MNAADTKISLAALDQPELIALEPQTWRANVAALEETAPALARRLEQTRLPDFWRPVRGLDGFPTWRVEEPAAAGTTAQWLDGTAAPRVRATGLLSSYQPEQRNPVLAHLGASGELDWLLAGSSPGPSRRMPRWLATYIFEPDHVVLAAVLRLHDFSTAIRDFRCIFVPPGTEEPFLLKLLRKHPGLLPPGDILLPDRIAPQRLDAIRSLCETLMRTAEGERSRALLDLVAADRAASPGEVPPRVAILSLHDQPQGRAAAAALVRAARTLGSTSTHRDLMGPLDVHMLPHARAIAELAPQLTLCVDLIPPAAVGLTRALRGLIVVWCTTDIGSGRPADADLLLAASPAIERTLRTRGPDSTPVEPWYWACEEAVPGPDRGDVVLVADLPAADPEAFAVSLSSHQVLWKAAYRRCLSAWESAAILRPDELLRLAERESRLPFSDGDSRRTFVTMIERIIAPAAIAERIATTLVELAGTISVFGAGWERLENRRMVHLEGPFAAFTGARAMVFTGHSDPLRPELLAAAAAGCPILLHHPGGSERQPALGGVLHPSEHYTRFTGAGDLRTQLAALSRDALAFRERAARARAHVLAHHTYAARWTALWQRLSHRGLAAVG